MEKLWNSFLYDQILLKIRKTNGDRVVQAYSQISPFNCACSLWCSEALLDLWAAKYFLRSPSFTLVVWCVMGWVMGVSWLKILQPPCPFKEVQWQTSWERTWKFLREDSSLQAGGEHLVEVVNNVRSSALWRLFTELRIPDWEKSKSRSANPVSLTQGCKPLCPFRDSQELCLERKEHLITAPDSAA